MYVCMYVCIYIYTYYTNIHIIHADKITRLSYTCSNMAIIIIINTELVIIIIRNTYIILLRAISHSTKTFYSLYIYIYIYV